MGDGLLCAGQLERRWYKLVHLELAALANKHCFSSVGAGTLNLYSFMTTREERLAGATSEATRLSSATSRTQT